MAYKACFSGFGFAGYRSFSGSLAKIGSLQKINFIIGQNNVGKSNIVNFLHRYCSELLEKQKKDASFKLDLNFLDQPSNSKNNQLKLAFSIKSDEVDYWIQSRLAQKIPGASNLDSLRTLVDACCDIDAQYHWFVYRYDLHVQRLLLDVDIKKIEGSLLRQKWNEIFRQLLDVNPGGEITSWVGKAIERLSFFPETIPKVEIVPATRKIGQPGSKAQDFRGEGIIDRIAKIQRPNHESQHLKETFNSLVGFVKDVLESPEAEIDIPDDKSEILVHMDGKTLPLESLGTGIHEVIILAAAATMLNETIVCIEEPELHLHPLLQKKLVNYLSKNTDNKYIFTTHSAHLLDAVEASIFHVTMKEGASSVETISSNRERFEICSDLGYKASDLLQSNCIIWVEGPSDRVYLNYWISAKNPKLKEGEHYSIMYYGGRLASHLTATNSDENEGELVEDLISLRRLNRNCVILMDSDKASKDDKINATKERLINEFNEGPGFAWVTEGREVENYLDYDELEKSVISTNPTFGAIENKDEWTNLLKKTKDKKSVSANKVGVARHYVEDFSPKFEMLDLNCRIDGLIEFIEACNC